MASTPRIEETVQQSPFVFVATVVKLGASTVANFEVQAGTAIVKVTRSVRTPEVIGDLAGRQITVQLAPPLNMKAGDQAIFYARGLVYADSMVVQEVAPRHSVSGTDGAQHLALVTDAVGRLPDLEVRTHSAQADLVVVGQVISVNLVNTLTRLPVSHHDPNWQEAVIQIESVEVGTLNEKTLAILFPASEDVKWYHVPKLKVGMEGVFLLHRRQVPELKQERLVILDRMDFHPRERVAAIRNALQVNAQAVPTKTPAGRRPKRAPKK